MTKQLGRCFAFLAALAIGATLAGCGLLAPKPAPASSRLDPAHFDRRADPCSDFNRYANGGWIAQHPVPADLGSWGTFHEVQQRNERVLRQLLEAASARRREPQSEAERVLGEFYCACMDEARAEREGAAPLRPWLQPIEQLEQREQLVPLVARLHAHGIFPLFAFDADAGFADPTRAIAWAWQGGLGLPDRDDYLLEDEPTRARRAAYEQHVQRMHELLGETRGVARASAARVLAFETELARASMDKWRLRDPRELDHCMSPAEASALTPGFDWERYVAQLGLPPVAQLNLSQPDFFAAVGRLCAEAPLEDWRAYLRWRLVAHAAPVLSRAFVDEDFRFHRALLTGVQRQAERWKRCLGAVEESLGEALGQAYVAQAFAPQAKERARAMVDDLIAAFRARIEQSAWMSAPTRERALQKLARLTIKIGYPDEARDWSGLALGRGSHFDLRLAADAHELRRRWARIGQPIDRAEWGMSAHEVNAYYNPLRNEIAFPAGILQPPFFSAEADDALNYGAIGAVIGHELTHGFDDGGRRFDADGRLADWWEEADGLEFERRAQLVREHYAGYTVLDELRVDGELTLGENIADLGGVAIAYDALRARLAASAPNEPVKIDGFTPEQRFFLAWARTWRANAREQTLRLQVQTDEHAPAHVRAVAPLWNHPAFAAAFGCAPGEVAALAPAALGLW